jgi:hypothetical protein
MSDKMEPKMQVSDFAAEVERLKAAEKMPSLETVLRAVAETRAEYREKILAARKLKRGGKKGIIQADRSRE